MKHKFFTLLFAILASLGTMFAQSGTCGDNLTWNLTNGVLTISGTGAMEDYTSSSKAPWFAYSNSINSVVIGDGVTSIGEWAFSNCNGMTSATIGNSVASIGDYAFFECSALTSTGIPNSVTTIGNSAFIRCTSLESVVIPGSVTRFGNYAFYQCNSLSSVVIVYGVTSIGIHAFDECSNLASVSLPNSITSIEEASFRNCSSLTSVTIPNSVISIGESAFRSCTSLTSVSIPNSVKSIGNGAFAGGWSLASVEISNSVTSIDESAFGGCSYITNISNHAIVPQVIVESTFSNVNKYACTLYVPAESVSAYQAADVWKDFKNIQPINSEPAAEHTYTVVGSSEVLFGSLWLETDVNNDMILQKGDDTFLWKKENVTLAAGNIEFKVCEDHSRTQSWPEYNYVLAIAESGVYTIQIYFNPATGVVTADATKQDSCVIASGTCGAQGDNLTWTLSCDSVLTISGTGAMADYEWNGAPWYSNKESIKSVIIENGVTSIGDCAFFGCSGLTSVTIPNSVTSIGEVAFRKCTSLTTVEIPNSVTSIGNSAFASCIGLTFINVTNDNPNYCSVDGVLFNKEKTVIVQYPSGKNGNYTIPNSVTSIGGSAFIGCTGLTSVTIPNSVTSIGSGAFLYCRGLTSIEIPNGVTSIRESAFYECSSLTSIEIPNSVTSIGYAAFYSCSSLTYIEIPNSVTSIGDYAFSYCRGLTSITNYATEPQTINANVFNNIDKSACTLYVPAESVEAYKAAEVWKEFGNIVAIEDEPAPCITASGTCGAEGDNLTWTLTCDSVLTISGTGAMADFEYTSTPWRGYHYSIKYIVVSDGVTSIGEYAFNNCEMISIEIPGSITSIGKDAFIYCNNLASIHVALDNTNYCSEDNILFNKDKTTIIQFPCGIQGAYTIPNSVTRIDNIACGAGLEALEIPSFVKNIISVDFRLCANLTSVINHAETPQTINAYAFKSVNLSSCALYVPAESVDAYKAADVWKEFGNILAIEDEPAPCIIASGTCGAEGDNLTWTLSCDSVLTISGTGEMEDYQGPSYCPWYNVRESIKSLVINESCSRLGNYAFYHCINLTNATISNSVVSMGYSVFSGCENLISINLPENITSIEHGVFASCTNLPSIIIPNNVTTIETFAFAHCHNLRSVDIPSSVKNIGSSAFINCFTLDSLIIPNSVTSIGDWAFWNCGCTSLVISDSLTSIGNSVFGQTDMPYVNIPNSVTSIGNDAFHGSKLVSIDIPEGVISIGKSVFENSLSLSSVNIGKTVTNIGDSAFYYCVRLRSVTDYAIVPQTIDANVFLEVDLSACTLSVPTESLEAYKAADVWKEFGTIKAIEGTTPEPCVIASGACGAEGDNLTWTLTCDSVLTISGTGAMEDYSSNSNWPWYSYRESITSVVVEDGVTSLGSYAFYYLVNVTSITLPNTVTQIGWYSIGNCYKLTSITIPASVTYISGYAFSYCEKLTAFNVDQNNSYYSSVDGVLFNKDQTQIIRYPIGKEGTHYTIPNTVVSIYDGAFASTKLESIDMPNGINKIGGWAFSDCMGLTSIVIPDQVSYIGTYAFSYCRNLESVTIPMSVTNIANGAFIACDNLKTVTNYSTIPQRVDSACFSYFRGGYYITTSTLYVPAQSLATYQATDVWKDFGTILPIEGTVEVEVDTITVAQALEIGATLAENASTDTTYTIRGYVSSITTPFSEQYLNQTFYIADDSLSTASSNAQGGFYVYRGKPTTGQAIREGALVELTTAIKNYNGRIIENAEQNVPVTVLQEGPECRVFSGTCGENVTWTFDMCDSVLTISGTGAIDNYTAYNSAPWYEYRNAIKLVIIENSVTSIGDYAFWYCRGLSSVTIPNSVTNIGDNAFYLCTGLTSVTIPNSVTNIGIGAFYNCSSLTSIEIPNSVTSIGEYAFCYCNSLTSVTIPNNVTYIGYDAFYNCNNLKSITVLGETPASIDYSAFGNTWSMQTIIYVPCGTIDAYKNAWSDYADHIQYLPKTYDYAIYTLVNDGEMGYVTLPASLCEEDKMTAMPYDGYHFVRWSDGVTINPRPFVLTSDTTFTAEFAMTLSGNCGKDFALTWVFNPETKTLTISGRGELTENYTFRTAALKAENIVLNNGMTAIGASAFEGCDLLNEIVVPASVTAIWEYAFSQCTNLESITILNGEAELLYGVVSGCQNLKYIEAPASILRGLYSDKLKTVKLNGGEASENISSLSSSYNTLQTLNLGKATLEYMPYTSFISNFRVLKNIVLPENLTKIDYALLADCYYIESIIIPAEVTEIADRAFEDCRSLASVEFAGDKVQRIGDWAFYNCHELNKIDIPEGVTEIGKAAFYGCSYAQVAHLPASVQVIGDNAFAHCSKIAKMEVYAIVPPAVEDKTFYEVSTTAPVYVPENSVQDYKDHPVWGKLNIVGNAPQGVDNVQNGDSKPTKVLVNGQILILRGEKVYTVTGEEVR